MEQTNNNKKERFEEGRMNANFVLTFERNLPEKNIFLCLFVNLFCCLFCEKICFIVMPSFFMGLPMNVDVDHHEVPLRRIYFGLTKGLNLMMFAFEIFNKSGCERIFGNLLCS